MYESDVSSSVTTKLAVPFAGVSCKGRVESPAKLPVSEYVPAASLGVMLHVAVPVASVVAVQVSSPFNVNVTGSPGMGALVIESVSTPETDVASAKSPVAELTMRSVGSVTVAVDVVDADVS